MLLLHMDKTAHKTAVSKLKTHTSGVAYGDQRYAHMSDGVRNQDSKLPVQRWKHTIKKQAQITALTWWKSAYKIFLLHV